ncbi:MAG TPA: iduronate-2-sulfatase [Planctomycetaceae bacterium]|nr:iduronate-2-sulfatase [Planctomycetaceae bacterium]
MNTISTKNESDVFARPQLRRSAVYTVGVIFLVVVVCCKPVNAQQAAKDSATVKQLRPNVLFLAVDDLNDWIGVLGGHTQAKTPNLDRLAKRSVLFDAAYCAAPLCHPSRTAILTGLRSSTTGIYGNRTWFRDHPDYKDWVTLPQYFRRYGYKAWTGGKIFHQAQGKFSDPESWDGQYSKSMGTQAPPENQRYLHGMRDQFENKILARLIDWGPIDIPKEETRDWRTVAGAADFLKQAHEKPFFLACGVYRPHLPWYAPREFFEMHPLDEIEEPPFLASDLDDIPARGRVMAGVEFDIIQKAGKWKEGIQGYLAATSFADACIGHVLDALDSSEYRDNTIVVLWGDHGYHIGDKRHWAKSALWQQTARTPLMVHMPAALSGSAEPQICTRPVSLVDLYPTLVDLCGLPVRDGLDGRSFAKLVREPQTEWPYAAVITHSPFWHGVNHAVRSEQYYYIRYRDGGEELYDMTTDPNQWLNLASDPAYSDEIGELKRWLPKTNAKHFMLGDQ